MKDKGCNCGAIQITAAGWRQLTPNQRTHYEREIRNCQTCKRDRELGR